MSFEQRMDHSLRYGVPTPDWLNRYLAGLAGGGGRNIVLVSAIN